MYENNNLILTKETHGKSSDALPEIFSSLLDIYKPDFLYYTKGPGSFMAIKIAYIFLRTLSISLDIPLKACTSFDINNNQAIKAYGNIVFIKQNDEIITAKKNNITQDPIILPQNLNSINFTCDIDPLYVLPAV